MNYIELIEKISGLISHVTYSWQGLAANVIACASVFFLHSVIRDFYVTLDNMNNPIITVAAWLFIISVYALIHRSVSAGFAFFSKLKAQKAHEKTEMLRQESIRQNFMALSKKEMAILKFVLLQDLHSAWLPDKYKPVMILIEKGYLIQIGLDGKSISDLRHMFDYSFAHLFTVPDNIQQLIVHLPPEFSKKWRSIKPDRTLQECQ